MSNVIIVLAIVVYLAMMLYIGFIMSNKNKNTDDFYLGGRKLGPLVTAMSAEASDMSSWLLMGLPGVAYLTGIADAAWTAIGLAIGTYLNWLLVARRIRVYTHTTNSITIPDFFADRYGDKKHILSSVAAVIIIIFFIPYTASGFAACRHDNHVIETERCRFEREFQIHRFASLCSECRILLFHSVELDADSDFSFRDIVY